MAKPSWITCTPSSGEGGTQVNVKASSNTGVQRSGSFTVKTSSGLTKAVSVTQAEKVYPAPSISCLPSQLTASKDGSVKNIQFTVSVQLGYTSNSISCNLSPSKWGTSVNSIEYIQAGSIKTWESNGSVSIPYTGNSTSITCHMQYRANAQFVPIVATFTLSTYTHAGQYVTPSTSFTLSA